MSTALYHDEQSELFDSRTELFYTQCPFCDEEVEKIVSSEINDKLMGMYDLTGTEYDNALFEGATICVPVFCEICNFDFQKKILVTGTPIWNYNCIDKGKVPKVEYFDDCGVLNITDGVVDTSLRQCFKNYDTEDEDNFIDLCEETYHELYTAVSIIAKSTMNTGFCFLGIDNTNRILRPIITTSAGKCCWSSNTNLILKQQYLFRVIYHPDDDSCYSTPYPHRLEDMVVHEDPEIQQYPAILESIGGIAKDDINELFFGIKDGSFVEENTITPSAGIIRCSISNIKIVPEVAKTDRCILKLPSGTYNFPLTALEYDKLQNKDKDACVVLGLARPFQRFNPARCYILVVGIHVMDI